MYAYSLLKGVHVAAVTTSFALFALRGVWMMRESDLRSSRFARIVPHVVDTLLLGSAIALAVMLHQYPFVHGWLTAKLLALFGYIVLGSLALKHAPTRRSRVAAFVSALLVFGYIVTVAITRDPAPFVTVDAGQ